MIELKTLPGTGLKISPVCLGGGNLGGRPQDADFALLDAWAEAGGNLVDTANIYGKWLPAGDNASERRLGEWLKSRGMAGKMLVSTKGGHPLLQSMGTPRLSPAQLAADLDESLAALGVAQIDLYWLHRDDPTRPAGELLETLNAFQKQGKIRAFGCSNWAPARIAEAADYAAQHGIQGFCANQLMWNLAQANLEGSGGMLAMDAETLALQTRLGMPAFAYMSLANGFFDKVAKGAAKDDLPPGQQHMYWSDENLRRAAKIKAAAQALGLSPAATGVLWLLRQKLPCVPVIGCGSPAHLADALAALNGGFSGEALALLDALP